MVIIDVFNFIISAVDRNELCYSLMFYCGGNYRKWSRSAVRLRLKLQASTGTDSGSEPLRPPDQHLISNTLRSEPGQTGTMFRSGAGGRSRL